VEEPGRKRTPLGGSGGRIGLSVVLLVSSTALALWGAEFALRSVHPSWTLIHPPVCFRPDLFEAHPRYGYRLHPGRTLRHEYPAGSRRVVELHANAAGFRGAAVGEPDGRRRVTVLGDSMTFGEGVDEAERFTERLEAASPAWRVENLGMIGYGPDLMLRAFEAVALAPPPAAVVAVLFTDDFRRVAPLYTGVGFPIPRFLVRDGALVDVPYPEPRWWERTLTGQGLLYAAYRYGGADRPVVGAVLERLRADAARNHVALGVAFVPDRRARFDDRWRRDWLAAWAARAGVAFLDVGTALGPSPEDAFYLPDDPHWSADGHARVAAALGPFVAMLLR
jgi:hypothetical protein